MRLQQLGSIPSGMAPTLCRPRLRTARWAGRLALGAAFLTLGTVFLGLCAIPSLAWPTCPQL